MKHIFLPLIIVLYTTFLFMDFTRTGNSTLIKYASLLICVIFSLHNTENVSSRLTAAAMVFTACADLFLLVKDSHYLLGVLLFLIVQTLYCVKLAVLRNSICFITLPFRLLPALLLFFADTLTAISCLYFLNLAANTFEAWVLKERLFAIGLTLFVFCDVCVGAFNLGLFTRFTSIGMWLFYLPSQVCIVSSERAEA